MKKREILSENFEARLFKAADELRKNIDAAEYKHIVLGLIFLKYISDSFEELNVKFVYTTMAAVRNFRTAQKRKI